MMEELIIEKVQEELGVSDYVLSVSKRLAQQLPGIIVKYRKPKENPQTFKINLKFCDTTIQAIVIVTYFDDPNAWSAIRKSGFPSNQWKYEEMSATYHVDCIQNELIPGNLTQMFEHELKHAYEDLNKGYQSKRTTGYQRAGKYKTKDNYGKQIKDAIYYSTEREIRAIHDQSYSQLMKFSQGETNMSKLYEYVKKTKLYIGFTKLQMAYGMLLQNKNNPDVVNLVTNEFKTDYNELLQQCKSSLDKIKRYIGKLVTKVQFDNERAIGKDPRQYV